MDEAVRKNIQKTATKLFIKHGLRCVSIDDICNELHISKKTFYTFFGQKEELIDSVIVEHDKKQLKKEDLKVKPCDFAGNAIDFVMAVINFHLSVKNEKFVNFFYELGKYYPEIKKRHVRSRNERLYSLIKDNIEKGIEEGIYRSDFDIANTARFLTMQYSVLDNLSYKDMSKTLLKKSAAFISDIYIRVLCNSKGLEYYEKKTAEAGKEKKTEDFPIKDEDLDLWIDRFLNVSGDMIQDNTEIKD